MTVVIQGNKCFSETVKNKGMVCGHESNHEGADCFCSQSSCAGLREIGFQAGRTIELKRFEFARIKIGINVGSTDVNDRETVKSIVSNFVLELLKREELALAKQKYEVDITQEHLNILNACCCRKIMLTYGLTLKSGTNEYESHSFDVIEEIPLYDGQDIMEAFEELSDYLAMQLKYHHDRIKFPDADMGV